MKIDMLTPDKEYIKEKAVLEKICEECGRHGKIPVSYCNECWMTMRQELCKSKK